MDALPFHPSIILPEKAGAATIAFLRDALRLAVNDMIGLGRHQPKGPFEYLRPEQQIALLAGVRNWLHGKHILKYPRPHLGNEGIALAWVFVSHGQFMTILDKRNEGALWQKEISKEGDLLWNCARELGIAPEGFVPMGKLNERIESAFGYYPPLPLPLVKAREFLAACHDLDIEWWGANVIKTYHGAMLTGAPAISFSLPTRFMEAGAIAAFLQGVQVIPRKDGVLLAERHGADLPKFTTKRKRKGSGER